MFFFYFKLILIYKYFRLNSFISFKSNLNKYTILLIRCLKVFEKKKTEPLSQPLHTNNFSQISISSNLSSDLINGHPPSVSTLLRPPAASDFSFIVAAFLPLSFINLHVRGHPKMFPSETLFQTLNRVFPPLVALGGCIMEFHANRAFTVRAWRFSALSSDWEARLFSFSVSCAAFFACLFVLRCL